MKKFKEGDYVIHNAKHPTIERRKVKLMWHDNTWATVRRKGCIPYVCLMEDIEAL